MIFILTEPNYAGSLWGQNLLCSLRDQLRQKRLAFTENAELLDKQTETVFIVASDFGWTKDTVQQLNRAGIRPILLCNQLSPIPGCMYSCVCSDVSASMKFLLDALCSRGKQKPAIYGINPNSISDRSRVESLLMWSDGRFPAFPVFENNGSLSDCFTQFHRQIDRFDAVICANDFTALSLLRHLEQQGEAERIIPLFSCAQSLIAQPFRDRIFSLAGNFDEYGRAAVQIREAMLKNPAFSCITVGIAWTSGNAVSSSSQLPLRLMPHTAEDTFYRDPELREMMIAEKLLACCDATDRQILCRMTGGEALGTIAEACYMAENSVKYRLRRMQNLSGASDRAELLTLCARFIYDIL